MLISNFFPWKCYDQTSRHRCFIYDFCQLLRWLARPFFILWWASHFFVFLFLIGTDQSANRWPPTVAIPRQSDRPSSSLIRFHLQQQQQQQDPLSRHLLGSLASFLLPVSLNLSEYIFFSRVSTWKKKLFGYLVVGELYSMAWPPACLLFIFFWKTQLGWPTTRARIYLEFFFSPTHELLVSTF